MTIQQRFQQANGILEKADLLFDEATCRAALERMAAEIARDGRRRRVHRPALAPFALPA